MRSSLVISAALLIAAPAQAEIFELQNPAWKPVPNTEAIGTSYVETNSIIRSGQNITYDVVNAEAAYSRVEMNCKAQQFRTIRMGYFSTRSRINYKTVNDPWMKPETNYHKALATFICSLPSG
jgi:hypothetical protein